MPIRAKTSWLLQISNPESRISAAVSSPSSAGTFGRGEVTIPLSTDAILKRPSARALAWAGDPKLRWSTPSDTSSCRSKDQSVECAVPSPLAGHAVNPSMEAPRRHPCRRGSRNRQGHRTRKLVGCFFKDCYSACDSRCDVCSLRVESTFVARLATGKWSEVDRTLSAPSNVRHALLANMHADHLRWSLPAHRRGTLRGMDAA
ncbi:hypothetical protein LMG19144_02569 [Xanthomonas arboricola pv. fragariae]|nr:hypothetical protein LMG19144_02569 [Xanthomonas arboricola pv. fragariae]